MTATLTHPDFVDDVVIHRYSRADALADGVLVDVSETARRMGFRHPVAVTQTVWLDSVYWGDDVIARKTIDWIAQDTESRLCDVLWAAIVAARSAGGRSRIEFVIERTPTDTPGAQMKDVRLVLAIGPGDDLSPVITISMPGED